MNLRECGCPPSPCSSRQTTSGTRGNCTHIREHSCRTRIRDPSGDTSCVVRSLSWRAFRSDETGNECWVDDKDHTQNQQHNPGHTGELFTERRILLKENQHRENHHPCQLHCTEGD